MSRVTLHGDNDVVVGVVEYTNNMDTWNGSNWQCGDTGLHAGIGKLKYGGYYLCHGSQWQDIKDYAEVISEEEAKEFCLLHNPSVYEEIFGEEPENLTE